jgi:hypothetical protein
MDPLVRRARATVTEAWAKGRRTSLGLVGEQGLLQRCEVRYHGDLRCSQMLTRLAPAYAAETYRTQLLRRK